MFCFASETKKIDFQRKTCVTSENELIRCLKYNAISFRAYKHLRTGNGFVALIIIMMMMISNLFVQKQRKTWELPNVIRSASIIGLGCSME